MLKVFTTKAMQTHNMKQRKTHISDISTLNVNELNTPIKRKGYHIVSKEIVLA